MDVYIAKLRKLLKDDEGLEIINVQRRRLQIISEKLIYNNIKTSDCSEVLLI